jgi:bacillithiol system protein YtxJ
MPIQPLTVASAAALAEQPGRTIVFKDSLTCDLSQWAAHQMSKLVAQHEEITLHRVDVRAQRPLSQDIEAHFGVRHESPQILIIEDGKVVWHASHRALSVDRVRDAISGATTGIGARM